MLTPSAAELLTGVADALASTVLPELGPGPARRQVQAAIGITRRVAGALPGLTPSLVEDSRDVAASLGRLVAALPSTAEPPGLAGAVAAVGRLPAEPVPPLDELAALDRRLHELAAEVAGAIAAGGGPGDADAEVRALLARMLARQDTLGLSPWEG